MWVWRLCAIVCVLAWWLERWHLGVTFAQTFIDLPRLPPPSSSPTHVTAQFSVPGPPTFTPTRAEHLLNLSRLHLCFCLTSLSPSFTPELFSPLLLPLSLWQCVRGFGPPGDALWEIQVDPVAQRWEFLQAAENCGGCNQRRKVFYSTDFQFYWFSVQWARNPSNTHTLKGTQAQMLEYCNIKLYFCVNQCLAKLTIPSLFPVFIRARIP